MAADSLHRELGIQLSGYRQAVGFFSDSEFQNYVELKAGGKPSFERIIKGKDYKPYYWYIRHFLPGEARELTVRFTPTGEFLGFIEKIPEDEDIPSLSREEAQFLADSLAVHKWQVPLQLYTLIEAAKDQKPNSRIDHTFTYERKEFKVGEALFRMKLVVSGNRLTTLDPMVKLPETFTKEFEEMRSFNMTLSTLASALMAIFYGFALIYWLVVLLRKKTLLWKPAIRWAVIIFVLMFFAQLNYFSFYWFGYQTSASVSSFVVQQIIMMLIQALMLGLLAVITFTIAEAITREAFPEKVQFWKVFDRDTAPTKSVLGMVVGGYLVVPLFLAYVVGFYIYSSSRWGWWYPSSTLSDPNILGSFFPWISAIGQALQAGFWEEAMFRALPLATMAIIGTKLKKRGLFIVIGLIIQALIFSGAHASYAQQPYYFRLVELMIPSLAFAFLYLKIGLLPAVIMHFAYDAFLMNLSSFLTKAPGLVWDRIIFIIVFLIPLIIVLWRKVQSSKDDSADNAFSLKFINMFFKGWKEVPESSLNRSFALEDTPDETSESMIVADAETDIEAGEDILDVAGSATSPVSSKKVVSQSRIIWYAFTLMILMLLIGSSMFRIWDSETENGKSISRYRYRSHLQIRFDEAQKIADQAVIDMRGEALPPQYESFPSVFYSSMRERYHVLRRSGLAVYCNLLDKYIFNSGWEFMYKRFDGSLEERLEIYRVRIRKDGSLVSVQKEISEEIETESFDEASARELAQDYIKLNSPDLYSSLKEVLAQPTKLTKRTDWLFTWQDESQNKLSDAQARINVRITGKQVSGFDYYIFIPEEQSRILSSSYQKASTLLTSASVMYILFILSAVIFGFVKWSRKELSLALFFKVFIVMILVGIAQILNNWKLIISDFSTVEPYSNQLVVIVIGLTMKLLFLYGAIALIFSWGLNWIKSKSCIELRDNPGQIGILFGFVACFTTLMSTKVIPGMLILPDLSPALTPIPLLAVLEKGLSDLLLKSGLLFFLWYLIDKITGHGTRRRIMVPLICLVAGFVISVIHEFSFAEGEFVWNLLFRTIAVSFVLWIMVIIQRAARLKTIIHSLLIISASSFIMAMIGSAYQGAAIYNLISYILTIITVLLVTRAETRPKEL